MLNYDDFIVLDAEDLAECGIREAYERLLPRLREFVQEPAEVEEFIDDTQPSYAVQCAGKEYAIYSPDLEHGDADSWGLATNALFAIVNDQLAASQHRLYAIGGGHDLGCMFLTQAEALDARKTLPNPTDWPYLPTDEDPWYGQHH